MGECILVGKKSVSPQGIIIFLGVLDHLKAFEANLCFFKFPHKQISKCVKVCENVCKSYPVSTFFVQNVSVYTAYTLDNTVSPPGE